MAQICPWQKWFLNGNISIKIEGSKKILKGWNYWQYMAYLPVSAPTVGPTQKVDHLWTIFRDPLDLVQAQRKGEEEWAGTRFPLSRLLMGVEVGGIWERIRKTQQHSKDQGGQGWKWWWCKVGQLLTIEHLLLVLFGCFDKSYVPGLLAVTVMRVEVLEDIHPRKPRFF